MSIKTLPALRPTGAPWNKGRIIGQKRTLLPKHVWSIRVRLEMADNKRVHPVGHANDFFHVTEDHPDRHALRCQRAHQGIDLRLAPTSIPRVECKHLPRPVLRLDPKEIFALDRGCPFEPWIQMRILLVEDDSDLATWLSQSLVQSGFIVEWEEDGVLAERRIISEAFDAVVLDLGLPSLDGTRVLSRLRAAESKVPILIVTARDSLVERVGLLRDGADDFLAKPFAVEELEARLIALIRRSHGHARGVYSCGPLTYDQGLQRFTLGSDALLLSPREHSVLLTLIVRVGEPMSKQQILDRLVGTDSDLQLEAIEVIIHRVRRKLGDGPVQIVTLRGLGYFLEMSDATPP